MPTNTPNCLRCQSTMELGFMLDLGDANSRKVARWVEGTPEKSFWLGLKIEDRATLDVVTYRCSRCGFLESYAMENPSVDPRST